MDVHLKVLEKLPDKNNLKFLHLQRVTLKSDKVIKLSFSSITGTKEFILVKTVHKPDPCLSQSDSVFKNMLFPMFFIEHNSAFYAVFTEDCVGKHQLQEQFQLVHIELILKSFANSHGQVLRSPSPTNHKDDLPNFLRYFRSCMKKVEENLNSEKDNIDVHVFKTIFDKLLKHLEKTMVTNHWVPSVGNFDVNPVFFKYDLHGKPIEFKMLMVNSFMYVPPLFDILALMFVYITEQKRRESLHEFLQLYYMMLKKELGDGMFNCEQFNFQITSFIPLLKLIKFAFALEHRYHSYGYIDNNLQELTEILQCPRLLREECYEIMANYLGHTKYLLRKFSLTSLQHRYGNLGDYFKLNANINLEDKNQEVNVFVKFLPTNNDSTHAVARNGPSIKEDFFYNFFVKEFGTCGLKDFLDFAPKCFLSKPNYVLVLEDLGLQGYRLVTEQNYFTYDMLKLTVKKLAQLHACSLVFEETKSKELQKNFRLDEHYSEYLGEIIFQRKEENVMMTLADVGINAVTNYLIYLYPEVLRSLTMEEFHKRSKLTFKNFFPKVLKSDTYRNTLCHGDTWDTNIMFKFDNNNSPIDCKLVDFQMTRYCPPIQDVLSHLYLTTTRDTRTKHLSSLLVEYYEELSKIVTRFGFDMETILSAQEFHNSCHYMKSQAVCQTLLYAPTNLATFEERASVYSSPEKFEKIFMTDRRPFIEELIKKHPLYKIRIGDYIQDLYDICEDEQY